tara:strand:- start:171 stop:458 length:288 start_codon:yes stop_codon:yes gene_type:complete
MGLISAIIALLKAVPSLERLFLKVADGVREAQAKARYDAKLTHIDNAMRSARGLPDRAEAGWSEGTDRTPTIPEGRTIRARVDEGGIKESSGTGI